MNDAKYSAGHLGIRQVYSKQPILGLTQEWLISELCFTSPCHRNHIEGTSVARPAL